MAEQPPTRKSASKEAGGEQASPAGENPKWVTGEVRFSPVTSVSGAGHHRERQRTFRKDESPGDV